MKNLKLKVWDPNNNKMITNEIDEYISFDSNGTINNFGFPKNVIPLLFTGLKDRKSKEIYEGDILKGINCKGYVYYNNGMYLVKFIYDECPPLSKDGEEHIFKLITAHSHTYIIGNKFENPELLK